MKKVIFTLLIAFISITSFAEKADTKSEVKTKSDTSPEKISLSGNVIDEISGEALVGVEVLVKGTDIKTYTDFDGHFVIENLQPGQCKLITSYTSYNKNEKSLNVNSESNQVKIELQASR